MNKTVNVKNITLISMGIALNVVGAFIAKNKEQAAVKQEQY